MQELITLSPPLVEITLFGALTMRLLVPATQRSYPVNMDELNPKYQLLLAYLALHYGESVHLHTLFKDVYGSNRTQKQNQEAFNMEKKEVRRKTVQALKRAERVDDRSHFPAVLALFERKVGKLYQLSPYCRVSDLVALDTHYTVLEEAIGQHSLHRMVPERVVDACTGYISSYKGDMLETLLVQHPSLLDDWEHSWLRDPYTKYKHQYLMALLYAGEYHRQRAEQDANSETEQEYYKAAELFARGALAACNDHVYGGHFDRYVSFSDRLGVQHGGHVLLAEQMFRQALACYEKSGWSMSAHSLYTRYQQQMLAVSQGRWSSGVDTALRREIV